MCACYRLDYPGIGPEHSHLKDWGRAEYYAATDREALDAFQLLSKKEGIIPALETSHALAYLEVGHPIMAPLLPDINPAWQDLPFSPCKELSKEPFQDLL